MGNDLFNKIIDLTKLPEDDISLELTRILEGQGVNPESVSLGQLREALIEYVQDVFVVQGAASPEMEELGNYWDSSTKLKLVN